MESLSDFSSFDNYDLHENSDLHKLKAAWRNEQAAPDLLPYEKELVNEVNEAVQNMEELIEKHMKIAEDRFRAHLFQIELNRVKYVVQSYLKIRLMKIQKYHRYISNPENNQLTFLSLAETTFLENYTKLVDNHLNQSFLKFLPDFPDLKSTTEESMITPFPKRFVFIHALKEVGEFQLSPDNMDDVDDIQKDSITCVPYASIKSLLTEKFVELL